MKMNANAILWEQRISTANVIVSLVIVIVIIPMVTLECFVMSVSLGGIFNTIQHAQVCISIIKQLQYVTSYNL